MSDEISVEEGAGHSTVSRRTLLKGAAVVGGTVWAAPVIESFASKAYAAPASAGTPNVCLKGIVSISWLALIVEDTHNQTAYVAKIGFPDYPGTQTTDYNSPYLVWGTNQTFPCGSGPGNNWTPTAVNGIPLDSGAPPALDSPLLTLVSAGEYSITVNVASDAVILQEEEHGGAGAHNGGSTCASTNVSFSGPGNITFYANTSGSCP